MSRFIRKYFIDTQKYIVTVFLIGMALLTIGVAVSWSKRLGGYGWTIYMAVVTLWVWDSLKRIRKANRKKSNNDFKMPPVS